MPADTCLLNAQHSLRFGLPFHWWGAVGSKGPDFSLSDLIENGTVTEADAISLTERVEAGESICIASSDSGAGKTTLLTALLDFLPPARKAVIVQGVHERFAFLNGSSAADLVILASELSPFLPSYCWGVALTRLLEAHSRGYQVLSTIHAHSAESVAQALRSCNEVRSGPDITFATNMVYLEKIGAQGHQTRRVSSISRTRFGTAMGEWVEEPANVCSAKSSQFDHSHRTQVGRSPAGCAS